jgi:hypothetical protein
VDLEDAKFLLTKDLGKRFDRFSSLVNQQAYCSRLATPKHSRPKPADIDVMLT